MDKATHNFQAFSSQFKALAKDGCRQCHQDPAGKEIPRKDFVDADSMAMVDQLGTALAATPPNAKAITDLAGGIGNAICLNCHLVHLPAQNTKDIWETFKDVLTK